MVFFEQICDSLIIDINGQLCMKFGKNPSGSFNTLTDNTFALVLVFLYCIARNSSSYFDVVLAYLEISAKMVGDDSICEDDFRLSDLDIAAKDLGFELKPECKAGPLEDCSFLNSTFYFHPERHMWIQQPNFEKLFSNVFYNFKKSSWRYAFVKLCAARKLAYAFEPFREELDDYIKYVIDQHTPAMEHEKENDKELTYHAALSQYMPNSQNDFLVFGDESLSLADHNEKTKIDAWISKFPCFVCDESKYVNMDPKYFDSEDREPSYCQCGNHEYSKNCDCSACSLVWNFQYDSKYTEDYVNSKWKGELKVIRK
jgi:hypothetical protein